MRVAWVAIALLLAPWPATAFEQEVSIGPLEIRHGHAEITAKACLGTPFEADAPALIRAQLELDFPGAPIPEHPGQGPRLGLSDLWRALWAAVSPDEQRKHFLRWWSGLPAWRTATHPLAQDWAEAVGFIHDEVMAARSFEPTPEALRHLGAALHALQDSFSPAHGIRDSEGTLLGMRYYPSLAPGGHAWIRESGDQASDDEGRLVGAAQRALEASHALLVGYAASRQAPSASLESFLRQFEARYLQLKP